MDRGRLSALLSHVREGCELFRWRDKKARRGAGGVSKPGGRALDSLSRAPMALSRGHRAESPSVSLLRAERLHIPTVEHIGESTDSDQGCT